MTLPPLPTPADTVCVHYTERGITSSTWKTPGRDYYTADQMHAYATAAGISTGHPRLPEKQMTLPEPVATVMRSDFETRMIGCGASITALSRLKSGEYLSPSIDAAWEAEKRKYAAPPQQKPLTDEQIMDIPCGVNDGSWHFLIRFSRAIERAHGIT